MLTPDNQGVLLRLHPSAGRRILALASLYALCLLTGWLAFTAAQRLGFVWTIGLTGFAVLVGYMAERMRKATQGAIELVDEGLRDTTGAWLAQYDQIRNVQRGTFAFKPSNGFTIELRDRADRGWAPGLWWRFGRRVGVGGTLSGRETRFLAETMALTLAQKQDEPR